MTTHNYQGLDHFCSGHMVVSRERKIVFCNAYICNLSDRPMDVLINRPISDCFTKASNIFIDSYIYPLLLNDSIVEESQISWLNHNEETIPVVANITLGQKGVSYWSIYTCTNRDQLYNELILTKEKLEEQSRTLYQLAITDPLTGLINRRELLTQVKKVTSQVTRNASTFALISIDIDFFKRVNDAYGHQVGDSVLVKLADIFMSNRRAHDLVARVGGEEFILLLPDIDEEGAFRLAEKLRINIEENPIENIPVTISIGLVVSDKNHTINFETLLSLSDKALFDAKRTGRNKTVIANVDTEERTNSNPK